MISFQTKQAHKKKCKNQIDIFFELRFIFIHFHHVTRSFNASSSMRYLGEVFYVLFDIFFETQGRLLLL